MGSIPSDRAVIDVLDGAMIVLATFTMNFLHPGLLLGRGNTWKALRHQSKEKDAQYSGSMETVTDANAYQLAVKKNPV